MHTFCEDCRVGKELVPYAEDLTAETIERVGTAAMERAEELDRMVENSVSRLPDDMLINPQLALQSIANAAKKRAFEAAAAAPTYEVICPGKSWLGKCRARILPSETP